MILLERFINLFDDKEKQKYANEVWELLQSSYKKIGGLKGAGFNSQEDMIKNIPFWKLAKKNGKIVAVAMYKDRQGRKRVAIATDGSQEGKDQLEIITREDVTSKRSFAEVSGSSLNFILKRWKGGDITKFMYTPQEVQKILKDDEIHYPVSDKDHEVIAHPELKKYFYQRDIGGHLHTKLMIGTSNNNIIK